MRQIFLKMKKLFLIVVFFSTIVSAQVTSLPSSSAMMSTHYEGVSVNESSGRLTQSIPLLNYSVGKLNIPISLNYVGNGVKVSQISGWVGTNWSLTAGGVITRVVNGYPDEKATQRIFFDEILAQGPQLNATQYLPVENDTRDFRVDIFSFSFPGYSGSFYLDQNMVPRLFDNNAELKIEFVGGVSSSVDNTILITTPAGEKYYFGGVDASEKTSTLIATPIKGHPMTTQETQTVNQVVSPLATTAFYLFKVENHYGDEILIDYYDNGTKNFVLFEKQELSLVHGEGDVDPSCFDIQGFSEMKKTLFHGTISNSKKIKKIYSSGSNLRIDFISSDLLLPSDGIINTPQYDDKKLDYINVFNTSLNENIKKIALDYLLPNGTTSFRYFLEKISVYNSTASGANACESFRFEYNSPQDLPSRFSRNVDLLGYFNGHENTTLIAQDENMEFDNAFQNLAIREPNFEYASKGALTKIINPMGGVTEFEYESPHLFVVTDRTEQLNIYRNSATHFPSTKVSDSFTIGDVFQEGTTSFASYNPKNQIMKVKVFANVIENGIYHLNKIIVEVKDVTTNAIQSQAVTLNHQVYNYETSFQFNLIEGHLYTITLKQDPIDPTSQHSSLEAFAQFEFEDYVDFEAMGLRLKSVKDYSESSELGSYKRYYYKKVKDLNTMNDDSAVVSFDPKLDFKSYKYCCNYNNIDYHFNTVTLIADPFAYYFSSTDNQAEYKYVTISYGGDNFEQGGVEKHFRVDGKEETQTHLYDAFNVLQSIELIDIDYGSTNFNNSNCFNGTLLKEKIVEKVPGVYPVQLNYKSETEYVYNQTIDRQINNVVIVKNPRECIMPRNFEDSTQIPAIGHYSNYSFRNNLVSVIHHEFAEPVSVDSELVLDKISTIMNYEYGNLRGVPTKISKLDSKGDAIISEFKYAVPSDLSSMIGVDVDNMTAYTTLYNQNNIVTPIQTVVKKQREENTINTLSTVRNLFLVGSNNQVLPQKVMVSKADSPLKGNVEFTTYDSKNNLVEITQENQIKKSIIYGYNDRLVIAELSNLEYDDLVNNSNLLNDLKTLSNSITDQASELVLYNALNQLRSIFPNAQISTNVYNKYLQLKSSTNPRGYTVYYEYDDCKRLRLTKDKDGNIIEEYKYNLKNN